MRTFKDFFKFVSPDKLNEIKDENELGRLMISSSGTWTARTFSGIDVVSGLYTEQNMADFYGVPSLTEYIISSFNNPAFPLISNDEFLFTEKKDADFPFFSLPDLPLSSYLTSGIIASGEFPGINLSFHRIQRSGNNFVIRVVERHLWELLSKNNGRMKVSILFGVSPAVAMAAAYPLENPGGELALASVFDQSSLQCFLKDEFFFVKDAQIVVTGEFTGEYADEGPFVDITGTTDKIRKQPVFKIHKTYINSNPVFPVILPSGPEHKFLMGFSRKIAIYQALKPLVRSIRDISLTEGGAGWLHAVVSCTPATDASFAIGAAALYAHSSLKRVVLVNEDIDPHDPVAVEWALATRFQPHKDIQILENQKGSSLDPSADNSVTSKWILNAFYKGSFENFRKLV